MIIFFIGKLPMKMEHIYDKESFVKKIDKQEEKIKEILYTFDYIFFKFKKGIFVNIKKSKIKQFIYFDNLNFTNDWHDIIISKNNLYTQEDVKNFIVKSELYSRYWYVKHKYNIKQSFEDYFTKNYKKIDIDKFHLNVDKWYANNGLIRYEKQQHVLGKKENNTIEFYEMITEMLNYTRIEDCVFFINRRDFPLVYENNNEPYYNIFGKHKKTKYNSEYFLKIFSQSISNDFKDILIPTAEDWRNVCNIRDEQPTIKWENKINKFVFRGSSTGSGFNDKTNKRLKLANLKNEFLDVGISKWQLRPKILNGKINFIKPNKKPVDFLSFTEQKKYKFIINVEGNVSAFRLSNELSSGSCLLIVDSVWKTWLNEKIKPYVHYVPVKSDLSDLNNIIKWCLENDEKCKIIANNALMFSIENITKEKILQEIQCKLK